MLILVKATTNTFSLDVDANDTISVLITKVADRASLEPYQFQLLFAGEPMEPTATVSSHGIKRESTVHLNIIKYLSFDVQYDGEIYENIQIANNAGVTVRQYKSQVIAHIKEIKPEIKSKYQLELKQGNSVLLDSSLLHKVTDKSTLIQVIYQDTPTPPPIAANQQAQQQPTEPEIDNSEFVAHFIENSISNDVEIVFVFDTTGSMSSVLKEVRTKVVETITRLMKEIPSIRIGIMGLGDYCDGLNVLNTCDLTSDISKLVNFVNKTPSTGGGDEPEAYEYALLKAKELSWSKHTSKALVMIGDSPPHSPQFTSLKIDWVAETDNLEAMGVKIYGVVCMHERHRFFYQTISERTGGLCLSFNRFNLITEMFLAVCFRESSGNKLKEFRKEAEVNGDAEMSRMFDQLERPNYVVSTKMYDDEGDQASSSTAATPAEETSGATTPEQKEQEPPKQVIKKRFGVLTSPQYFSHDYGGSFINVKGNLFVNSSNQRYKYLQPVVAMAIGNLHIGFTTLSKAVIKSHIHGRAKIYFHDYRMEPVATAPQQRSIYIACYATNNIESFNQLENSIREIKKMHPECNMVLVGIKPNTKKKNSTTDDITSSTSSTSTTTTSTTTTRSRSKSFLSFGSNKDKSSSGSEGTITKEMRQMLVRNSGLQGDIEYSIDDYSSMETQLAKICKKLGHKFEK
ncbi:hypothetical protein DFA_02989 [Cavenderia fasciculata]|uniref:Ubiquitin-like domain-containing protein n=1 Tax=Cavenderia fasciculata TaxID=261658 RepID=F4PGB1_CACFS|nr:uncharacterized protein DFA_02989 [Cavenderia fasciculata]EGG24745.1 hypothetical protein DFA_02989 [Cavenderia fasciculata]|eukprot:XP_004362596.1 hypothetical protein DFA_02989 [Cavenderia fasciculata]